MSRTTLNNGDTGLAARTALNANFTELYGYSMNDAVVPSPWIHAICGDSIAVLHGARYTQSYAFHALAEAPRQVYFDTRLGGIAVGPNNFGLAGINSTAMTATANMAAIAATNPHSLEIVIGRNDNLNISTTTANILVLIDYLRAQPGCRTRSFGIHVVLPGTANSGSSTPWTTTAALAGLGYQMRQNFLALQSKRSGIFLFDAFDLAYDPTSFFGPIGAGTGAVGSVLNDGVHPSAVLARLGKDRYNTFLDQMGLPRAPGYKTSGYADFWDVTNNPTGNLLGSTSSINNGSFQQGSGTFSGSGATANITGQLASGWLLSVTGDAIPATLSIASYTDPVTGRVSKGQLITLTSSGALTQDTTINIRASTTSSTPFDFTKRYLSQSVIRLANPVGLIDFGLNYTWGGVSGGDGFGAQGQNSLGTNSGGNGKIVAQVYDALTQDFVCQINGRKLPTGATSFFHNNLFQFRAGTTPSGTVMFRENIFQSLNA